MFTVELALGEAFQEAIYDQNNKINMCHVTQLVIIMCVTCTPIQMASMHGHEAETICLCTAKFVIIVRTFWQTISLMARVNNRLALPYGQMCSVFCLDFVL